MRDVPLGRRLLILIEIHRNFLQRAARASSHRGATGRSAANPIALPDDDDDVTNHVAGAGVQPPRYRAPKVEPGGDFGSPSRRSKLLKVTSFASINLRGVHGRSLQEE